MGAVFLGRDPAGGLVAVKVIRTAYARDENFRARFRSEVNRAREVPAFRTAEVLDADPNWATSHHTRAQEMVGTLAYMSPERFTPDAELTGLTMRPAAAAHQFPARNPEPPKKTDRPSTRAQ